MDGRTDVEESANDEEEEQEETEGETITTGYLPQIILVWRIPYNMFQYSLWTLTNRSAVGGSLLYSY
jgi:hypothetical protein